MKKKILFLIHLSPPIHGASIMGNYIYESKKINNEYNCQFVNFSASNRIDEVGHINYSKIFFLLKSFFRIAYMVFKFKPDLCYLTPTSDGWAFYRDFIIIQFMKLFKLKIILHFHNKASHKWGKEWYNKLLLKYYYKEVKVVLLGNQVYLEKSKYVSEENVFYCPNAVISKSQIKTQSPIISKKIKFLFVSNMMKTKGVYVLLKACQILKERCFEFQCDFVGAWKDVKREDFVQRIEEYNLVDEVFFHGEKYNDEKDMYFASADVFVFPTYYHSEVFSLVLLEAMDFSLPCISTNNGAIESIIVDGITGFCVAQENVETLAEKMIWMIENPEKRLEMGLLSKKRFDENFTFNHFENNLFNIVKDCLK
ncbi:glycosyltransferase involved in cell wall biosynthesis [Runella defluvii]|uniref:Glycosyltransferase involved in cell wall biosynthesis n=1 Tax=Runella defluvii TaxID=370973 RepID=A0A7W6ERK9_9BACT|nr:glycosyltransferase family 4 protein [Runella defluvii]MBB3839612.1 glycosyltransferase involved in cell wall biosynthesis [Runella defluvii]